MSDDRTMIVDEVLATIDRNITRWRTWFPSEDSHCEVSRRQLVAVADEVKALRARVASLTERLKDAYVVPEVVWRESPCVWNLLW